MYTRILASVDGSQHSEHALRHAVGLAKALGAALRIVHVVDMGLLPLGPELALDTHKPAETRSAEGKKLLAAAAEVARTADVAAEARLLVTGVPAQQVATLIVQEAASWPADVIVLGATGRGRLGHLLLGSVADAVAKAAAIPVLLVH